MSNLLANIAILATPLGYLRITTTAKRLYDFWIPAFLTVCICLGVYILPGTINVFGSGGLIYSVMGILQMLTGFYIAALAAVATFNSENIDKELEGIPAELKVVRSGQSKTITLNRRKYVCYLFGYLSFVCLFLYAVSVVATLIQPGLKEAAGATVASLSRYAFVSVYVFVLSNVFVTTLIGLHYLTDRIHR